MAGIGFLLKKLAAQDNLSGIVRAYFHSAIIAVGPWILVVLSISAISYLTVTTIGPREVDEFLAVMIYNFCFSFILAGPLYMITAREVSDSLYFRDMRLIPGILITNLLLLLIPAIIIGSWFYIYLANMNPFNIVLSIINFVLLAEIWSVMLYLGCIRDYKAVTASWIFGMLLAIYFSIVIGRAYGSIGILTGFNIGLTILLYTIKSHILAEYPYRFKEPKEFFYYFKRYQGLFWSGFFLYSGMWVDKIIMWFAPEAITHVNNLRTYPAYDGGMFFSYLTIIPVMALFIFSLETNFYDPYIRFIQHIERNAPLLLIEEEKNNIFHRIVENGRNFLVLQGSISILILALASNVFDWFGIDYISFGIFRLGVLGAFFQRHEFVYHYCFFLLR